MKKWLCMLGFVLLLGACQNSEDTQSTNGVAQAESEETLTEIQFSQFFTKSDTGEGEITEEILALEGKKVGIRGYMTELTPMDQAFIYLVPQPGAACPFCSVDNPKYIEAIAVYLPEGDYQDYSEQEMWAYGTLEVGEEVDELTGLISMFRLKAESMVPYQPR